MRCIIENSDHGGIVACDVTFSLLLEPTQRAVATNAWQQDILTKNTIEYQLIDYAEIWCNATAANSRIREISVDRSASMADNQRLAAVRELSHGTTDIFRTSLFIAGYR